MVAFSHSRTPAAWVALAALVLLVSCLPAREEKPDPAATREYAVAAGLQSKQLYAQAAQRWQKFIDAYPKDSRLANAYHHLGACQLEGGQPAEAVKTFRILIEKFPKSDSLDAAHFNLALALYNVGSKKPEDVRAVS